MGAMDGDLRVDKWLWAARLTKTRSLAADAVKGGRVQVNGQRVKPSKEVGPGDRRRDHDRPDATRGRRARRGRAPRAGEGGRAALRGDGREHRRARGRGRRARGWQPADLRSRRPPGPSATRLLEATPGHAAAGGTPPGQPARRSMRGGRSGGVPPASRRQVRPPVRLCHAAASARRVAVRLRDPARALPRARALRRLLHDLTSSVGASPSAPARATRLDIRSRPHSETGRAEPT